MLVRTLWSHLRGYVIIRAKGNRLEAFINEALRAGVHLWRLERATPRLLVARTEAADFSRLARAGRRLGVRVTALQKRGLPFVFRRTMRRRAFVGGGALFAVLLYALAQFVWFIDVQGTKDVKSDAVLAAAARVGLRPGVLRSELERDAIVHGLHRELPRIAWAGVEVRGALATVRIVERTEADAELHMPGHIVAAEDGIVERIVVTRGHAIVSVGDTVEAGQPLVSGMLTPGSPAYAAQLQEGQLPFVRAEGSVWGRVWYRGYAEIVLPVGAEGEPGQDVVARAKEQARVAAEAAIAERIPVGAEVKKRDVTVSEDLNLTPALVRANVTVAVYQNLGRFSPVPEVPEVTGGGSKDESDGQEEGRSERTGP